MRNLSNPRIDTVVEKSLSRAGGGFSASSTSATRVSHSYTEWRKALEGIADGPLRLTIRRRYLQILPSRRQIDPITLHRQFKGPFLLHLSCRPAIATR